MQWAERDAVVHHIAAKLRPVAQWELPNEYFYASLPLCLIDAIFSLGVNYESTARTVRDWCEWAQWPHIARQEGKHERDWRVPHKTMSEFLDLLADKGDDYFAKHVYKNSQRTSSKNGILKAASVRSAAILLVEHGVLTFSDLRDAWRLCLLREEFVRLKGQSSGLSFDYFLMLAGDDSKIKPDRMVLRFVAGALGRRAISPQVARDLVVAANEYVRSERPDVTPRMLDYEIWRFQRTQTQARRSMADYAV